MTAVDKTNDRRTLIPIMGIGQALVHHCNRIAAYVGDLPSYILLLDIIFALDIQPTDGAVLGELTFYCVGAPQGKTVFRA